MFFASVAIHADTSNSFPEAVAVKAVTRRAALENTENKTLYCDNNVYDTHVVRTRIQFSPQKRFAPATKPASWQDKLGWNARHSRRC